MATLACGDPAAPAPPEAAGAADRVVWSTAPVPPARLAALARGVNVTRWFRAPHAATPAHFGTYLSDAEIATMVRAGVRSVRLPVEPWVLAPDGDAARPDPARLALLERAVDRLLAHGLAVVVDLHPERERARVEDEAAYGDALVRLWEAVATRLAARSPERLFLEPLNEPAFVDREAEWLAFEERLLRAVRRAAPRHTLLVTGNRWSSLDGLLARQPVADRNVVYTFHFYEPTVFTAQATAWSWAPFPDMQAVVPFPGAGAACGAATAAQPTEPTRALVAWYCSEQWDGARIVRRLDQAVAWARTHGVALHVGEFGVWCGAPAPDRVRWLREVRAALDARAIPWAAWGWDDCHTVGAARRADGTLQADTAAMTALGLDPAALR